ncbi:hypothetical protein IIB50_01205 [Patescibacteria group bacterium]|nr:hypothetical protein [Patescibacteria group bacterium]
MKKIFAAAIAMIVVLSAGIALIVFYTPYNVPLISQLFQKETTEKTIEEPSVSGTGKVPVATTTSEEDRVDAEDKNEFPEEEIIPKEEEEPAIKPELPTPSDDAVGTGDEVGTEADSVGTEPEPTPEPEPEPKPKREPKEYIIEIYSFTDWRPASLTIYEGDTVTFINLDNTLHWPGSDPHPTHSSLPLFDALGGISERQSYSHTFTIPGAYGHHDHLPENPPTLGTITVLPRE